MDDLLDKIKEIKQMAEDIFNHGDEYSEVLGQEIRTICDSIIIDHQINQRLESETRHPEPDSLP